MNSRDPSARSLITDLFRYYGIKPMIELFGLGLSFCYCYSSQRLACNGYDGLFQAVQYFATAFACGLFFVAAKALRRNVTHDRCVVIGGLILTVGSAPFIVIQGPWAQSTMTVFCLAAISGIVIAWLYLTWGQFYANLSSKQAFACICGTLILSSIIKIFYDLLTHDAAGTLALLALPFISLVFWRVAIAEYKEPDSLETVFSRNNIGVLKGTCLGVSIIALGSGIFMSLTAGVFDLPIGFRIAAQIATIVIAVCATLLAYRALEIVNPFIMWFAIVLVIATGLAVGIFANVPLGGLSSSLFTAAQMMVIAFWYVALADISHRSDMPSDLVFGLGWGIFYALPMGLGILLPHVIPTQLNTQSFAVIVIWMLLVALVFLRQHQAPQLRLFADFDPHVSSTPSDDLKRRVYALGKRHGLSARESEIIMLYARGRTRAVISDQLCISENTVRDHIKSAYKKINIHEKQELIELIENQGQPFD